MTAYMSSCAHATAAFAVLSETINAVKTTFQDNAHKQLLTQLQKHEKEKLNLTAAYHLERIRQQNNENEIGQVKDVRIAKLLDQGVQSLQQKLNACVEEINEVVEEIRYAMLELQQDEEEE